MSSTSDHGEDASRLKPNQDRSNCGILWGRWTESEIQRPGRGMGSSGMVDRGRENESCRQEYWSTRRGRGGGSKKKRSDRSPQIAESERGCQGLLPGSEQGHCGFGASDSWLPKEYLESSELSLTRYRTLQLCLP